MQGHDTTREAPTPAFTWEALERALKRMAASPEQAAMTASLVAATKLRAAALPADLVLEEIVCMASVVADESWFGGSRRSSVPAA
jgi:hypothetical protein